MSSRKRIHGEGAVRRILPLIETVVEMLKQRTRAVMDEAEVGGKGANTKCCMFFHRFLRVKVFLRRTFMIYEHPP